MPQVIAETPHYHLLRGAGRARSSLIGKAKYHSNI